MNFFCETRIPKIFLLTAIYYITVVGMDTLPLSPKNKADKKWHPYLSIPTKAFAVGMVWSHDNAFLAVGRSALKSSMTSDGRLYIFNTKTWERTIVKKCLNVVALAYSSDDSLLAVGCGAQATKIFDTKTWKCKNTLEHAAKLPVFITYSPNNEQLALELREHPKDMKTKLCIFETENWACIKIFNYNTGIDSITYSSDSAALLIRSTTMLTEIFDTKTWKQEPYFYGYQEILPKALVFKDDDDIPITSQDYEEMKLLLSDYTCKITALECSSDGKQVAIGLIPSHLSEEYYKKGEHGNVCIFVQDIPTTDQQDSPTKLHISTPKHISDPTPHLSPPRQPADLAQHSPMLQRIRQRLDKPKKKRPLSIEKK